MHENSYDHSSQLQDRKATTFDAVVIMSAWMLTFAVVGPVTDPFLQHLHLLGTSGGKKKGG